MVVLDGHRSVSVDSQGHCKRKTALSPSPNAALWHLRCVQDNILSTAPTFVVGGSALMAIKKGCFIINSHLHRMQSPQSYFIDRINSKSCYSPQTGL